MVVWRLDRLARSLSDLIEIVRGLEAKGVGFSSLTEAIDTKSAGGRLIFHIFGSLSEFERHLIRERTAAGLKAARDRGRVGGRPRALVGDKLVAAKKLLKSGMSPREVAAAVGVSPATLYRHVNGGADAR